MQNTHIEVKEISNATIKGWTARVYPEVAKTLNVNTKNESINFSSKKLAWKSIKKRVEKIDFEKNKVYFNLKKISSYADVELEVNAIEEKIYTTEEQNDAKKIVKVISVH